VFRELMALVLAATALVAQAAPVPELRYAGELIAYPGPWAFQLGKPNLVLVNDQQLDDLTDPDKPVNLSLTGEPCVESLRQLCERAQAAGFRTVILAHDHFFSKYRQPTEAAPRASRPWAAPIRVRPVEAISSSSTMATAPMSHSSVGGAAAMRSVTAA
jgi:hypothetical protein